MRCYLQAKYKSTCVFAILFLETHLAYVEYAINGGESAVVTPTRLYTLYLCILGKSKQHPKLTDESPGVT